MKTIKRKMKFADAYLSTLAIRGIYLDGDRQILKDVLFFYVTDVIDRYNKYLLRHGYTDSDIVDESNLDEWLKLNL